MAPLLSFGMLLTAFCSLVTASPASPPADACPPDYIDWRNFKANGVNLGGWLVQEPNMDPTFWSQNCGNATDEWTCCAQLGHQCGPILEHRYATFYQPSDIDKLARGGVKLLRIPTTYAAWTQVPGSQLYSGRQVSHLRAISQYAIAKHGMHIVIDIHSLPGGINGQTIGEADGHYAWFHNATNLAWSLRAVDAALRYIQASGSPQSYTLAPINEPVDNRDFSTFGFPDSLSEEGAAWLLGFVDAVLARRDAVDRRIPVMFQGGFRTSSYWFGKFRPRTNIVFDVHNYYFAGRPTDSDNVTAVICDDAKVSAGGVGASGKFPVFVGEWSIQTVRNNRLANRRRNLNAGLYAFSRYTQGSAYWSAKQLNDVKVDGEGLWRDYWNYEDFIDLGLVAPSEGRPYCD